MLPQAHASRNTMSNAAHSPIQFSQTLKKSSAEHKQGGKRSRNEINSNGEQEWVESAPRSGSANGVQARCYDIVAKHKNPSRVAR
jgi:hypothetical protein